MRLYDLELGLGFRVWGAGVRVYCLLLRSLGLRVWGLGFRV